MICVCDTETTSKNIFEAEIIHGAFFALDDDLNIVSEFNLQCNPLRYSEEAYAVHGIPKEECSQYQRFLEQAPKLIAWFKHNQITEFWCHANATMFGKVTYYDWAVLRMNLFNLGNDAYYALANTKVYSTHSLCKNFQSEINSQSLKLGQICSSLGIELQHHNARSDALACIELMKRFLHRVTREELTNLDRGVDNGHDGTLRTGKNNSSGRKKRTTHHFTIS